MRQPLSIFLVVIQLALTLMLGLAATRVQAQVLRVGIYEQQPDIYLSPDNHPAGILGELLNEIARREGWTLETQPCSWQQCMQWLHDGNIDLLPDVYYTAQRAKTLGFHHVPALHSWSQMYAKAGNTLRAITDLNGLSIAVLAGSTQEDYLRTTLHSLGIQADLIPVQDLTDGFQLVSRHQADAVAADFYIGELSAREYGLVTTSIVFQPTEAFFATQKGQNATVLAAIDHYLSLWQADPNSFYFRTLDHWRLVQTPNTIGPHAIRFIITLAVSLSLLLILLIWQQIRHTRLRRQLQAKTRQFDTILGSINALVSIKTPDGRYLMGNQRFEQFLGASAGHLVGRPDTDFYTNTDTLATIQQSDRAIIETGTRSFIRQTIQRPQDDSARTLLTTKAPLWAANGTLEGICTVGTDITDHVQAEHTRHRLTYYDTLTQLPNRRMALEHLQQIIDSTRHNQAHGALLQIDLDGFKRINDKHGYRTGDELLAALATRLRKATREHDLVAHTSADEFVVLVDALGNDSHESARIAMSIAENLRQTISGNTLMIQNIPVLITASIGLTLINAASHDCDTVMREADMATQRAKDQGGNQATFYKQDLQAEVEQRLWLEQDLLQAIGTPQLSLHLQPQFGKDGQITGGELLARWQHPTHGPISPALFIPVAEESGLINLLGTWTLGVACDTILTLQALGEIYPLSINISPKHLMEVRFVDFVRETLERKKVPGNRLIFEITEGVLIQDIQAVALRMQALAQLGIRFSIDDFGTGYSNLAYLKRLPLYELKIDKSLIQDLPDDNDSTAIVQLILAMADQLNLRVVAEGVETDDQARVLFQHDCHALQGFLLARPMPIDTWIQRVRKRQLSADH
ncbi:EAL domain-containing protein [Castellaniella sp.]|uniref:EAL domain-containing protein n=1 Tax=Castellaniella sp. TaxID=1955812 RepID=UPI002AFE016C|nr:EAL domain-containing protein [Castellaniella sp.]